MDAAGVYGGESKGDSFRQRALSMLLHPGAGIGEVPIIGGMAANMAETFQYGDLEKQAQIDADEKSGKISKQQADQMRAEVAPDPSKALTSATSYAMLPKAGEKLSHYVKMGGKWVVAKGVDAADAASTAAAATPTAKPQPTSTGILRPGVKTIAGQDIPVRADGAVAKTAEGLMTNSAKSKLQDFEVNKTQAAVRQGVSKIAANVADVAPAHAGTIEDPLGFHATRDAIRAEVKPDYEAVDEYSKGAFSKAQAEAEAARGTLDYQGKQAYKAALDKQAQIFDSIKAMADKGETPNLTAEKIDQMRSRWKQSVGFDELAERFKAEPGPLGLQKEGQPDTGYLSPKQFRKNILGAIREGEFEKAGFTPEHIQALQDMGVEMGKAQVKFNSLATDLVKHVLGGTVSGAIGGMLGGGVPGAVSAVTGAVGEHAIGAVLSKIMTSEAATKAVASGMKSGASTSAIAATLKRLWADESGEARIPGTGGAGTAKALEPEALKKENDWFQQAKSELPEGTPSQWALRAQELKTASKSVNGSGESAASQEAINRSASEKAQNVKRVVVDTRSGQERPLIGVDAVDYQAKPYESVEFRGGDRDGEVIDQGRNARSYKRKTEAKPAAEEFSVSKAADEYNKANGREPIRDDKVAVDRRAADIADAFDEMQHNPSDPQVKESYAALKEEIKAQWKHAEKMGIKIEPTDTDPYGFSGEGEPAEQQLFNDVEKNKHLGVWRGGNELPADHPLAEIDPETGESYNTMLRAVHDIFGHVAGHNGFDEAGEESAWRRHVQQLPEKAKAAMTTETRGQTSWFFNNKDVRAGEPLGKFAQQKAGVLPDWTMNRSAEFDKLANQHNANGGFTFNPAQGDMTGKSAFAVAGSYPELSRTVPTDKLTPSHVQSYMEDPAVAKVLRENPNASVGAWSHDGKTELEISETPKNLEEAKALAQKNNQVSIWDLKNGKEIPTGGTGTVDSMRVGQRKPVSVKSEKGRNPLSNLSPEVLDRAITNNPKYAQKLADEFSRYGSLKFAPEEADSADFNPDSLGEGSADPKTTIREAIKQMRDNIVALHDMIPRHIRDIARKWYDSAHAMTKAQATEFGVSHPQAAGVTAVLSPQNPWDNNISLAKRVMDVWKNKQDHAWSPEMNAKAAELYGQSPAIARFTDMIRGKTYRQLVDADPDVQLGMRALWTRIYDESHNPSTFERWAPDGTTRGIARNADGKPAKSSWFSLTPISKALSILDNGSMENIHEQLGDSHKVRNFYNNIIDPNSKLGDTTIDTHAVGVAHMSPFSLDDPEVKKNFGKLNYGAEGLVGTYPVYAEAYRQAAAKLGLLPRELQSITWEGIRSLFKEKTPELNSAVREIWKEHQDGNITIDEARKRIVKAAGGFKPTDWESDLSPAQKAGPAGNSPELSGAGRPEAKPQGVSGARAAAAGTVSTSGAVAQALRSLVKEVGMVHDPELAELNRQMRGRIEELEKKYPVGDALRMKQPKPAPTSYEGVKAMAKKAAKTPKPGEPVVKRAPNFETEGLYDVEIGPHKTRIFRDPENGIWYEEGGSHFSERLLGFNKKEALDALVRRLKD
jgi:hypothetical protein